MSFFSKLAKKFSHKKEKSNTEPGEEIKTSHRKSDKKSRDKKLVISKTNICSIYNKEENYKPLSHQKFVETEAITKNQRIINKYKQILENEGIIDIDVLRRLAWQGVPMEFRPSVWKILLKYMPLNKEKQESTIQRKRDEYANFVTMYYDGTELNDLDETEKKVLKIIKDDVHRTQPDYPLFREHRMQQMMIRLLWVWHVRHPACGYVQGINDLTTPFIVTFLKEYIEIDYDTFNVPSDFNAKITEKVVEQLEADVYWCLSKILDGILDNYTHSQMGNKALTKIKDITRKIDPNLYNHLENNNINFTFFSIKWMFCLLIREFPLKVGLRLFDTYISDEQGCSVLHNYVCAALLLKWSIKIKKLGFAEIMVFLQNMPTKEWGEQDIEMIVAEAYVFMTLYEESHGNFNNANTPTSTNNSGISVGSTH